MPRLLVDIGPLRRNRDFRLLFTGQLVSLLGSNLTVVAAPCQVYRETHSSLWVGLACLSVAGAIDVISTMLHSTILQNAITDEFRRCISSIKMAAVTRGPRVGDLESGVVANFTSTQFSIVSGGIACIVGVIAPMR
jgi:hypothetical protein